MTAMRKAAPYRGRLDRAQLIESLRKHLPELRERYAVLSLAMFGSYARGEARRGSDLDLLVEFERAPSLFTFVEMELSLSELLGVKVDLVMKDALKPAIGRRILSEALPL